MVDRFYQLIPLALLFSGCNLFGSAPEVLDSDDPDVRTVDMHADSGPSLDINRVADATPPDLVALDLDRGDLPIGMDASGGQPVICSETCDIVCDNPDSNGCVASCGGSSNCSYVCSTPAAVCDLNCSGLSNCNGRCEAGGCNMQCSGQSNCTFECPGGGCTFSCTNQTNCSTSCTGGGCTGP